MTIADQARNLAISLEAKKDGLQQRQNGDWCIRFTVQGIDMNPRLTAAPMGTRFAMVLVEIGDDEMPKEVMPNPQLQPALDARPRQDIQPDGAKGKMDWRELQPAAQAGIRCADPIFAAFLRERNYDDWDEARADAADCVRLICGIRSRSELGTNHKARIIWHQLDQEFQEWQAKERVGA